jgi:hypothetical protein
MANLTTAAAQKAFATLGASGVRGIPRDDLLRGIELDPDEVGRKLASFSGSTLLDFTLHLARDTRYKRGAWGFVAALVAREALGFDPKQAPTADLRALDKSPAVVRTEEPSIGGVTVCEGNLRLHDATWESTRMVVVLGDVHVGRRFTNECGAALSVAGDLDAGLLIESQGLLHIGGVMRSPIVLLILNDGYAKLVGGAEAKTFFECDQSGSRAFGPVRAKFAMLDALHCDVPLEAQTRIADLEALLVPDLAKEVRASLEDGDEELASINVIGSMLVDRANKGVRVFREGPP